MIEPVVDEAAFAGLAEEWSGLPRLLGSPFLRHEWFSAWWRAFGVGELHVLSARRDGRLVGVLPLARHGRSLMSLANRHSQVYSALALDETVRAALASEAAASLELQLEALLGDDVFLTDVAHQATRHNRVAFAETLRSSPFVATRGSLTDFRRDRLSAETRRSLSRSLRRLERDHSPEVRVVEAVDDAGAALDEFFALEHAGWKGRDGTSVLSSPSTAEFFRELGAGFAAAGILRGSTISIGGEAVAFELSALDGNRLWSMKTAYDERVARYSPGRLLRLAVIERCFELGLETNEMLGADESYKMSFATGLRTVNVFRSYARTPLPLARLVYRRHVRPAAKSVYLRTGGLKVRMAMQRALVRRRG